MLGITFGVIGGMVCGNTYGVLGYVALLPGC